MRFGVNTLIWSASVDLDRIPFTKLADAGVDGIEVPLFAPDEVDVAGLRRRLSDHGMACTACSIQPPGGNPVSEDAGERRRALEHWRRVVEVAVEAGIELLAGPSYAPVGHLPGRRRTPDEWRRAVEFHQELAETLDEAELDLAIEPINRFETYFLNTAADAVALCEGIGRPRVGILLDTFHSNIEDKSVAGAYRACGRHLKHVHTCENDRGVPGSGHVDWMEVFAALEAIEYDGWLTIESFNANMPELSAATAIWRDLAPGMDEIAVAGTRFLRAAWGAR